MNDLRQRLHDTLDHQHTDLVLLAARAQSQGIRLRRRRRLSVATGSIAMAAALAAGIASATQLLPGPPEASPVTGFAAQGEGTMPVSRPASGRAVTAALYADVTGLAEGTADQFTGGMLTGMVNDRTGETLWKTVTGSFAFTPAGATSPGEVAVSISHRVRPSKLWDNFDNGCPENSVACESTTLADGSTVVSYRWHSDKTSEGDPNGGDVVVATREVGDIKIAVMAHNGIDSDPLEGRDLPNLPSAVLTADQVIEIASGSWGRTLPANLADTELPSFTLLPGGAGSL